MKRIVLTLVFLLFSNFSIAGLYFEISLEEGGDKVSSESKYSLYDSDVNLGGGFKMGFGYYLSMGEEARNSLSLSLGYLSSENQDAEFKTTTFDAIYCHQVSAHRFGIGAAYHIEPEVNGDFRGVSSNGLDFDDATGLIIQYSYELMRGYSVGLRYTDMEYEVNGDSFDGSSVGFVFSLYEDFRDWGGNTY